YELQRGGGFNGAAPLNPSALSSESAPGLFVAPPPGAGRPRPPPPPRAVAKLIQACLWSASHDTSGDAAARLFFQSRADPLLAPSVDAAAAGAIVSKRRDGGGVKGGMDEASLVCDPLTLLRCDADGVWRRSGLRRIWVFLLGKYVSRNGGEAEGVGAQQQAAQFLLCRDIILVKCLLKGIVRYRVEVGEDAELDSLLRSVATRSPALLAQLLPRIGGEEAEVLLERAPSMANAANSACVVDLIENGSAGLGLDRVLQVVTFGLRIAGEGGGGAGLSGAKKRLAEISCNVLYNSVEQLVAGGGGGTESDERARSAAWKLLESMAGEKVLAGNKDVRVMIVRSLAKVIQNMVALQAKYGKEKGVAGGGTGGISAGEAEGCLVAIAKLLEKVKSTIRALGVQTS
ncbi:hypothetical protein TeGR_g5833, partial [Tetraparma gracilis]